MASKQKDYWIKGETNLSLPAGNVGLLPKKKRPKRWIPISVALLTLIAFVVFVGYLRGQINGGHSTKKVDVVASPDEGLSQFAKSLESNGVIGSASVFELWLKLEKPVILQRGTYGFVEHEPYNRILDTISKGPILYKLMIPDGVTVPQISVKAATLPNHNAAHFLMVARSGDIRSPFEPPNVNSLEGLLYPDTYSFGPSSSDATILKLMSTTFVSQMARLGLTPQTRANGLSAYQILIIASIIEKEAIYPGDANKVARVILNRLADNMKLQLDSTVFYALDNGSKHLSFANLQVSSPYNTYLHNGLPPTPISLPSKTAIEAALHPASGNWLYYVVVAKNGQEAFSSTYAGQLANEKLAQSRGVG